MQVNVYLSERDAIRAGVNGGMHAVSIDGAALSQAERDHLAQALRIGTGEARLHGPTAPTAESLIGWLRADMQDQAAKLANRLADRAARTEAWLAAPLESCIVAINGDAKIAAAMFCDAPTASWTTTNNDIDQDDPRVIARMSILEPMRLARQADLDAQAAEAKIRKAAAEAKAAADAKAAEEALRNWSTVNGSELLQERIAGNYNYKSLARREYAQSIAAKIGGDWITEPDAWECSPWCNPDLAAIKARKQAIAACPIVATGPGLKSCEILIVKVPETEDSAEDSYSALKITVRTPDNATVDLVQRLP